MDKLSSHLKRLSETNESPFHNIHALKYEVLVEIIKTTFIELLTH